MTNTARQSLPRENWHIETIAQVQQRIARAALNDEQAMSRTLGTIALHPHQLDAVVRIKTAIEQFGGALLADEVGLGKTFVALGLAQAYDTVTLLAPAALLSMWRTAIRATQVSNIKLLSIHALSRKSPAVASAHTTPAPSVANARTLVVIDEAHHLRTRTTQRYAHTATLCAGHDVLLMSATPLHNNPTELRALLALFMGARADILQPDTLAALIVRRTHQNLASTRLPTVLEHAPLPIPDNPPVLEALLTLPPPLPARDGKAAGALIRLGLLRAWCSSDAALSDTLRKRRMRGESLLHALAHGRYPTRSELRTWTTSNDSIQLGFPELLVSTAHSDPTTPIEQMLVAVTAHLAALEHLERIHFKSAHADPHRSALLRTLLNEKPSTPILAFSQFASTINALFRALSDVAGVAALTSHGGRVAGGPIARQDLISRFAPRAHERPPPPAHEAIRLLLTTDMLSEGVNLQDAGRLVHLDLPWTEAARAQRVGRLVRIGSLHRQVEVHSIAPPPGADRTLRIVATLARKAGLSREFVGHNSLAMRAPSVEKVVDNTTNQPTTTSTSVEAAAVTASTRRTTEQSSPTSAPLTAKQCAPTSAPDNATHLREMFQSWTNPPDKSIAGECCSAASAATRRSTDATGRATDTTAVAIAPARQSGWIAAIYDGHALRVWANVNGEFHTDAKGMLSAVDCANQLSQSDSALEFQHTTNAVVAHVHARLINAALVDIRSRLLDAAVVRLNGPAANEISEVRRRMLQHIARTVATSAPARRALLLGQAIQAERAVQRARGVGGEQRLAHWLAQTRLLGPEAWLNSWRADPHLVSQTAPDAATARRLASPNAPHSIVPVERVIAVLVFAATE